MAEQKKDQEIQELATVSSAEFYRSEEYGDVSEALNTADWESLRDAADSRDHLTPGEAVGQLLSGSVENLTEPTRRKTR